MNIYFVRHGESVLNATSTHQIASTPLSAVGEKQAEAVAERLSHLPLEAVIASHYKRAQQTGEAIAKKLSLTLQTSEHFKELDRPSSLHGLHYEHPTAVSTLTEIRAHHHEAGYKHSDEETFYESIDRAKKGIELIKNLPYDEVAVVSHGNFLRIIVGVMIFGERFDTIMFDDLQRFKVHNTGVTHCRYADDTFQLISWNDRSHFA